MACSKCGKHGKWISKPKNEGKRKDKNRTWRKVWSDKGDYVCGFCGITQDILKHTGQWQLDHIIPLSKGGLDEFENTMMLCKYCHTIKNVENKKMEVVTNGFKTTVHETSHKSEQG